MVLFLSYVSQGLTLLKWPASGLVRECISVTDSNKSLAGLLSRCLRSFRGKPGLPIMYGALRLALKRASNRVQLLFNNLLCLILALRNGGGDGLQNYAVWRFLGM